MTSTYTNFTNQKKTQIPMGFFCAKTVLTLTLLAARMFNTVYILELVT